MGSRDTSCDKSRDKSHYIMTKNSSSVSSTSNSSTPNDAHLLDDINLKSSQERSSDWNVEKQCSHSDSVPTTGSKIRNRASTIIKLNGPGSKCRHTNYLTEGLIWRESISVSV